MLFNTKAMIQKDYIQRMIEQVTKVLALLMGMDVPEDKIKIINEAYAHWLKANPDFLRMLTPENIVEVLVRGKGYSPEQMEFLAQIMDAEGDAELQRGYPTVAANLWRKSLVLFEYVDEEMQLFSFERMEKVAGIEGKLSKIST